MDIRRVILFSAFALICYNLWIAWQQDYPAQTSPSLTVPTEKNTVTEQPLMPAVHEIHSVKNDELAETAPKTETIEKTESPHSINVKTDVFNITIGTQHGDIIQAELLDYPVSVEKKNTPFTLLTDEYGHRYSANSNLFQVKNGQIKTLDFNFQSSQDSFVLQPDQKNLEVVLRGKIDEGITVEKVFEFTRGEYLVKVSYRIKNNSDQPWQAYFNRQILRQSPKEDQSSIFHVGSYTGASYSNPGEHNFKKVSFKDISKSNLNVKANGGWIAMQQHYFLSAWIPQENSKNTFYTRSHEDAYTIGAVSPVLKVSPSEQEQFQSRLYIGPEIGSTLKAIAPNLDLTIDYGWLWFLSTLLFSLMKTIHAFVGNWGWSIVLVTVLIKLAFYRLSATSYKSMANMRKLQPKLERLRERYGDDKAQLSKATMELYRQEKVNPLGGCLPILVQIPVFIALYWVLLESVELRQAPFIGWIQDLSAPDPYHVLPIIMGITMLIQQRLNPAPPDPMQARVMMFLPVLFTALFWSFPSGLVLYWVVNNSLSILQQWYITRKYSDKSSAQTKKAAANS